MPVPMFLRWELLLLAYWGEMDHSFSKWEAEGALFEVALKAVNTDRNLRYESVAEFKNQWDIARTNYLNSISK